MGRPKRVSAGGLVYHVLNRGNGGMRVFYKAADYEAFETILAAACKRYDMRLLAYCLMPNHWHLVLWPRANGDLFAFVGWLTLTHTQRGHAHRGNVGAGHVIRAASSPSWCRRMSIWRGCADTSSVTRYARALVDRAEDWPWGSLWLWRHKDARRRALLNDSPIDRPQRWLSSVNRMEDEQPLAAQRGCVNRGRPYGSKLWVQRTAQRLSLKATLRPRGRSKQGQPQQKKAAARKKGS